MKIKEFGKKIGVLVLASIVFGGSLFGNPSTGAGSTVELNEQINSNNMQSLTSSITWLIEKIKNGTESEVLNAAIDLGLLATNKLTSFSMKTTKDSTNNAIKRKIADKLKGSILKGDNLSKLLKDGGVNIIKSLIIDTVINVTSETIGEKTGSLAAKEFTWLALKNAEVYATSGGNPVSIAVGEALILKDVVVKNMEAYDELVDALDSVQESKRNGIKIKLEYERVMGAIKYSKSRNREERDNIFLETSKRMDKIIDNAVENNIISMYEKLDFKGSGMSNYFRSIDQKKNKPKEDPNKQTLEDLAEKDTEIKTKIKEINDKEKNLQSKRQRLNDIQNAKRDAFIKMKNAKKGSDEYNYEQNRFFSLNQDYRTISNEITQLIQAINIIRERNRKIIERLQEEKNILIAQIVDTTKDYNNDSKTDASNDAPQSTNENWRGYTTANIENRSDSKLRYWGGNFDDDVNDHPGGLELVVDSSTGKLTAINSDHGDNTATDNTNDFTITNAEMTSTSTTIKTLDVQKDFETDETLRYVAQTDNAYEYTSWGDWSVTGELITNHNNGNGVEHKASHNNWVAGQKTETLPTQGTATYNGVVSGHWYTDGDLGDDNNRPDYGGTIGGTMAMTVNFANPSIVAGTLTLKKADNSAFATGTMDAMQMSTTYNAFQGKLIGADIAVPTNDSQNVIKGRFYGPSAEEVGGVWNVNKTTGEFASGVFAGQK